MWVPLWVLLLISSAYDSYGRRTPVNSATVPHIISPIGGAAISNGQEDNDKSSNDLTKTNAAISPRTRRRSSPHAQCSANRRRSNNRIAWFLPSLTRWRTTRRKAPASAAGRAKVPMPSAGDTVPSAAFSGALASFVGAVLVAGGTLGVWPHVAEASPFDPRPPPNPSKQPFFEGWFIRLVDHEQRLSFAVILGSFRSRGAEELDQHYVSLSYLHEPKGGILPVEVEEVEDPESSERRESEEDGGGIGGVDGNSPRARASAIAKRFSGWIREQRLAVLQGFGVDDSGEGSASSGGGVEGEGNVDVVEGGVCREEGERETASAGIGDHVNGGFRGADGEAIGLGDGSQEAEPYRERNAGPDGGGPVVGEVARGQWRDRGGQEAETGRDVDAGQDKPQEPDFCKKADAEAGAGRVRTEEGEPSLKNADGGDAAADDPATDSAERKKSGATNPPRGSTPVDVPVEPSFQRLPIPQPSDDPPSLGSLQVPPRAVPREEPTERTHTFHAFPPAETVTISRGGEPVDSAPNLREDPNFTWEADGIGSFMVDGDSGRLSFQLPELSVAASFRHRLPWSEKRPNSAGPEGWLQHTGLLPLHYHVHSMGSEAGYSLKATDAPRAVVGRGSIHMEANYGESFPTGWVWAQGCSSTEGLCGNVFRDGETAASSDRTLGEDVEANTQAGGVGREGIERTSNGEMPARFILTGGRFVIGPVTTNSFVLAFRSELHSWNFRTTDLDRISVKVSRNEKRLTLVAKSIGDKRVLEADINAPEGSFGSAIYVPTPGGFSNAPGCVESYAATATFRLYTKGEREGGAGGPRPLVLREEVEFKLAALEFGGEFQDT